MTVESTIHTPEPNPGIVTVESIRGCSGYIHVDQRVRVYYDTAHNVVFAENLGERRVGLCDRSCVGKRTIAEFMAELRS